MSSNEPKWEYGDRLKPEVQAQCLRQFVHRFTRDHVPAWSKATRHDGSPYPLQFDSDKEWLRMTKFAIKSDGTLDMRFKFCQSTPTWPDGM